MIGVARLPAGLDPMSDLDAWATRISEDLVFEGLVRRDPQGAPGARMALADRCEVDAARATRRVTCHLRAGASFSDGREIEMEDVLYSAKYWLDPRRATSRARRGLAGLRSAEIVDGPTAGAADKDPGRWIRFEFEQRDPLALEKLAEIKIVPRKLHRGRESRFAREPVGSGSMRVVAMSNDRWVLERVGPDDGRSLQKLVLREFSDAAVALTALRRAEIHLLDAVAPSYVPEELGRPGMAARFRAWVRSPAAYDLLMFNARRESHVGGNLRHALVDAVPRVAISRELYGSPGWDQLAPIDMDAPRELDMDALVDVTSWPVGGEASAGAAGPGGLPWRPDPARDAEGAVEAADMLDAMGYRIERDLRRRNELNLRITLTWDGQQGHATALAEAVRASWRQLGIQTPEAVASWAYLSGLMRKGDFSVALGRLASHQDADLYDYAHSRGDQNLSGISDAALDEALVDYRLAETPEARRAAKAKIAARLEAQEVFAVLHAPAPVLLASRRVRGLEFEDDLPRLDKLTLAARGSAEVWDLR